MIPFHIIFKQSCMLYVKSIQVFKIEGKVGMAVQKIYMSKDSRDSKVHVTSYIFSGNCISMWGCNMCLIIPTVLVCIFFIRIF